MMLYFSPFAGVSGDMFSASLMDAGADFEAVRNALHPLGLDVEVKSEKVLKDGISATKFTVLDAKQGVPVEEVHRHHHNTFTDIAHLLEDRLKDGGVKKDAIEVFRRLAEAEAKIHATDIDKVHFHEVGAADAIADIVAGVVCIRSINPGKILSAPVNTGSGTVRCAHGILPVPAPATLELLKDCVSYSDGTVGELTTPTGAALLTHFACAYLPMPEGIIKACGYGAGTKTFAIPNLLRVIIY